MECIRKDVGGDQARAGPGRRSHWKFEIKKIRLQQTQREIYRGNGIVWPTLVFGVQSIEGAEKIKSSRNADSLTATINGLKNPKNCG